MFDERLRSEYLDFSASPAASLPFTELIEKNIRARKQGMDYGMELSEGHVCDLRDKEGPSLFRLSPEKGRIVIQL